MKIEGTVNIMGMNEVLFRQKYRGKFYEIVQYLKAKDDIWVRVFGGEADGFQRSHDSIISSVKSLSFNPTVSLTFNDGIMYVDFLKESLSMREWRRIETYTNAKHDDFITAMEKVMRS